MGTNPRAGMVVERFAARRPAPDRRSVLERWLEQLLAEANALGDWALPRPCLTHPVGRRLVFGHVPALLTALRAYRTFRGAMYYLPIPHTQTISVPVSAS
jgi:hypothetical protein